LSAPDDTTASIARRPSVHGDGEGAATLLVLAGKLPLGKMFRIAQGNTLIGRSTDAEVWVDDDGVSRQHARLVAEDEVVTLFDLGSRNGTFCNGERVERKVLEDGDKIQIG
jgi:pSer/pThr/pTyr-binding forkhead associated (FHA) protein